MWWKYMTLRQFLNSDKSESKWNCTWLQILIKLQYLHIAQVFGYPLWQHRLISIDYRDLTNFMYKLIIRMISSTFFSFLSNLVTVFTNIILQKDLTFFLSTKNTLKYIFYHCSLYILKIIQYFVQRCRD